MTEVLMIDGALGGWGGGGVNFFMLIYWNVTKNPVPESKHFAAFGLKSNWVVLFRKAIDKYTDVIISQNITQFYAQYVQYISQLHVSAHFRPSSGCSL